MHYNNYRHVGKLKLHEFFHINSSIKGFNSHIFDKGIRKARLSDEFCDGNFMQLDKFKKSKSDIYLDKIENDSFENDLFAAINNRVSSRAFTEKEISKKDFIEFIHYGLGLIENSGYKRYSYPIAGGIPSLRFIIYVKNVESILKGWYLIDPDEGRLIRLKEIAPIEKISLSYGMMEKAGFTIFILGVMKYKGMKYGDRGYRFLNIEAGHVAQNLYLIASHKEINIVASGGTIDCEIEKYSCEIGEELTSIYEIIIGN